MARSFIVTGGLGFLGQHLIRMLLDDGRFSPVIVDNCPGEPPEGADLVSADVRDKSTLSDVFAKYSPEFVVHAAAQLPRADSDEVWSTTVQGTENILELARDFGVKRTVFISSTAVYPPKRERPHGEEGASLEGFGVYGRAKVVAERLCAEAHARGQSTVVIRPKSFLGPCRMGVFQVLFQWILEGRRIPIIGSGENLFQLLDVEDLCTAILMLSTEDQSSVDGVFNVGATEYGTVKSDLGALCAHAGTGSRLLPIPVGPTHLMLSALYKVGLSPIYPWVFRTAAMNSEVNVERILAMGWAPSFSNQASLIRGYDWYRDHGSKLEGMGPQAGHRTPWSHGALGVIRHLF